MDILNHLIVFFSDYGYIAVFLVLIACGCGIPVPEDITLVAGGVICALSSNHILKIDIMIIIALTGVLIGDSTMFILGGKLGPKITQVWLINKIVTPKNYLKIQEKIDCYGNKILFIARFLPGLRAPIFVISGVSHKVPFWKFILMDGIAAIISVPILVYLGYFFANDLDIVLKWLKQSESLIIISVAAILFILFIIKKFRK